MLYLFSIVYGIIQGITEFLPISSTGHLVILHAIWPLPIVDDLGFDVILHLGTLAALLIFFWSDIIRYAVAFIRGLFSRLARQSNDFRLAGYLIIGTVPAGIIGYLLQDFIDNQLRSLWVVVGALALGALFFFWVEWQSRPTRELEQVSAGRAILIGLAQAVALIPGISRSGSTIITGLALGLKRAAAARFAFLLAIPITLGAGLKKVIEVSSQNGFAQDGWVYLAGLLASTVSGYLCIRYLLHYLKTHSLRPFGWYRLALSVLLIILLLTGLLDTGVAQHVAG
jgi:undecaprenyl-diphosphatase